MTAKRGRKRFIVSVGQFIYLFIIIINKVKITFN
jgi:hypothetical protein